MRRNQSFSLQGGHRYFVFAQRGHYGHARAIPEVFSLYHQVRRILSKYTHHFIDRTRLRRTIQRSGQGVASLFATRDNLNWYEFPYVLGTVPYLSETVPYLLGTVPYFLGTNYDCPISLWDCPIPLGDCPLPLRDNLLSVRTVNMMRVPRRGASYVCLPCSIHTIYIIFT